jgi:hypothetical protein
MKNDFKKNILLQIPFLIGGKKRPKKEDFYCKKMSKFPTTWNDV